jgi:Ca2+-binding RTX toxin-like protein
MDHTKFASRKINFNLKCKIIGIFIVPGGIMATSVYLGAAGPVKAITPGDTLTGDMTLAGEAKPHGVPDSYGWNTEPRVYLGNNPGRFQAITAWGQLYQAQEGNPATNTRVQLQNIRTYVLRKSTGQWQEVQATLDVQGAAYTEDFVGDVHTNPDVIRLSDGSISVTAGGGHNFHFWPSTGRVSIDPNDIAGVVTSVQARLVVADLAKTDDRSSARYVMNVGGDYWSSTTASWNGLDVNNSEIGQGRFKYVTSEWQTFTMNTLTNDLLLNNPPPIDFAQTGTASDDQIISWGGDDRIFAQGGNDFINGAAGNDTLYGDAGNDSLLGGAGNDTLYGGQGSDQFIFDMGRRFDRETMGVDQIADFSAGVDKIVLKRSTFTKLSNGATQFATVTTDAAAARSNALIVYNSSSGRLFYNANGNRAGFGSDGGYFANLNGNPGLSVNDLLIVN